jgi:hypothetical protein
MNKRRKRIPPTEEFNLDEIMTNAQQDKVFPTKRQKTGPDSELSRSTDSTNDSFKSFKLSSGEISQIKQKLEESCFNSVNQK